MWRVLFHVAAASSALLLGLTAGLWGRSLWYGDEVTLSWGAHQVDLESTMGRLGCVWKQDTPAGPPQPWEWRCGPARDWRPAASLGFWGWLGFEWRNFRSGFASGRVIMRRDVRTVTVPHAAAVLASAVLPAWWIWRRRRRPGTCRQCGYDLRGSTVACPECGAAITDEGPGLKPGDRAEVSPEACYTRVARRAGRGG